MAKLTKEQITEIKDVDWVHWYAKDVFHYEKDGKETVMQNGKVLIDNAYWVEGHAKTFFAYKKNGKFTLVQNGKVLIDNVDYVHRLDQDVFEYEKDGKEYKIDLNEEAKMAKIYKTLKQNSPEWVDIRLGKFTASDFHTFLGKSKKRTTAIYKKAAERITKSRCDQDAKIGGVHIERGNTLEPLARECYERKMNCEVEEIGFIEMSNTVGFSPDGFVGNDKILEIKCMDNHTYLNSIKTEVCPEHYTQIQFGLMVTGRDSADYVIYNPRFSKPLFVRNIKRDEEHIKKIEEALYISEKEIEDILSVYHNNF